MNKIRRPFWLPASNYYGLAVAVSAAFFILVWGILLDGGEDSPWETAGISAGILLLGGVFLREVVFRRARNRFLRQQRLFENQIHNSGFNTQHRDPRNSSKMTLEQNAKMVGEIKRKSDAAKILSNLSAGHREVFEICAEYILRNEVELRSVNPGSPRLAPLLKGRSKASEFHHYHLLKWAELEAKTLTNDARNRANPEAQVEAAQNALRVIESALDSYPQEPTLVQSKDLLQDLVVSIKISHLVEAAEAAVFEGDYTTGISYYRDALFYLGRDNVESSRREQAAIQITAEIERIRGIENL